MHRFAAIIAYALLPLALAACGSRDAPPPEAFGPHEIASPVTPAPQAAEEGTLGQDALPTGALPPLVMHKDPYCECCSLWGSHVEGAGFPVTVAINDDMEAIKRAIGVPADMDSCHTAEVAGYFIEGHVPAEDIKRLLTERPDARGLAAPGMPIGSPGMPGPPRPYTVYLIGKDGSSTPFSQHGQ